MALPKPVCGSRDWPGFALHAFAIEHLVTLGPTHHQAHSCPAQFAQPRRSCIAAIKQMQHAASRAPGALAQELAFLCTRRRRLLALATPPAHAHHLHRSFQTTQEDGSPLPASYHNGFPWFIEDPRSRALQALRFAGPHRSQSFQVLTLRFFQHTAIPHTQRLFACRFQLPQPLVGLPPEKLLNQLTTPLS